MLAFAPVIDFHKCDCRRLKILASHSSLVSKEYLSYHEQTLGMLENPFNHSTLAHPFMEIKDAVGHQKVS